MGTHSAFTKDLLPHLAATAPAATTSIPFSRTNSVCLKSWVSNPFSRVMIPATSFLNTAVSLGDSQCLPSINS